MTLLKAFKGIWEGEEVSAVAFLWKRYFPHNKTEEGRTNAFLKDLLLWHWVKGAWLFLHGHCFGNGLDFLGAGKQWSTGTRHAYSSFLTNRTGYMSWQSHWARRGERRSVFVCVFFFFFGWLCAAMRAHLCGFMSGDGRVVRYEVSSAQFGCGSEHNESDWGVFARGRMCLCILRMYMYSMCVRARGSVSSRCTIISSVCQFSMVTKDGYSGYSPNGRERETSQSLQASRKYTLTYNYIHAESWLRRNTDDCLCGYGTW